MGRVTHKSAAAFVFVMAIALALAFVPQGAYAAQDADGFCQSMLILGEIAQGGGANPALATKQLDYLRGGGYSELTLVPAVGTVVNPDFGGLSAGTAWQPGTGTFVSGPTIIAPDLSGGNNANFNTIYSDIDDLMTYAWTYVQVPVDTDAYLAVAPDDGSACYCNGVYIGESTGWHNGNDVWATMRISLLAGQKNLVMIKVFEGGGGHDLRFRIQTTPDTGVAANSTPVSGLTYTTDGAGYTYPALNVAGGVRTVSGHTGIITGGDTVNVTVTLNRASGNPVPIVDETVPTGWSIVGTPTVSEGNASVAGDTITWTFTGPMTAATATMDYTLQIPGAGLGTFSGTVDTDIIQDIAGTGQFATTSPNPVGIFDWHGDIGDGDPGFGVGGTDTTNPSVPGDAVLTGTIYRISGSGGDIWDNRDRCHIAAKVMSGDFIMDAYVNWVQFSSNNWAKAGVMVRAGVDSHNPMVIEAFRDPANSGAGVDTVMQWRDAFDGGAAWNGNAKANPHPGWLRIVRRGNEFTGLYYDGANWIVDEIHTNPGINPDDDVLACLAVSSHVDPEISIADFDGIAIASLPINGATRAISNTTYSAGTPLSVTITLDRAAAGAVDITETVPAGWAVANTNPAGSVVGNVITWTGMGGDTVSYDITPDVNRFPGVFVGNVVDAFGFPTPVGGDGMVAPADRVVFQQGVLPTANYAGTADAHIIMYDPNAPDQQNTGAHNYIEEGDWYGLEDPLGNLPGAPGSDDNKLILVRFEMLPSVPINADVEEAWFRMYYDFERRTGNPSSTPTILVDHSSWAFPLRKNWGEGNTANGVDGDIADPGEVTWTDAQTGSLNWEVGGARGVTDIDTAVSAQSTTTYGTTYDVWVEYDVTALARQWASGPAANRGMKISQDDLGTTSSAGAWHFGAYNFVSSENTSTLLRPTLSVKFAAVLDASNWNLYR